MFYGKWLVLYKKIITYKLVIKYIIIDMFLIFINHTSKLLTSNSTDSTFGNDAAPILFGVM